MPNFSKWRAENRDKYESSEKVKKMRLKNLKKALEWNRLHPEEWKRRVTEGTNASPLSKLQWLSLQSFAVREKIKASRAKSPYFTSTEKNVAARKWYVRDARGVTHQFINLALWIRQNTNLFHPEDLQWKGKRGTCCRAHHGISSLRPSHKKPNGSWKGWTWVSIHERRFDAPNDPLRRNTTNSDNPKGD